MNTRSPQLLIIDYCDWHYKKLEDPEPWPEARTTGEVLIKYREQFIREDNIMIVENIIEFLIVSTGIVDLKKGMVKYEKNDNFLCGLVALIDFYSYDSPKMKKYNISILDFKAYLKADVDELFEHARYHLD